MSRRPFATDLRPRRAFPLLEVLAFLACVAFGYVLLSLAFAVKAPGIGQPW